jgi:hypothetical protein
VIYSAGGAFGDLHLHAGAARVGSPLAHLRLIKRLFSVARRVGDARWECCGGRTPPIHTLLRRAAAADDGCGYRDLALYGSIALARINSQPLVAACAHAKAQTEAARFFASRPGGRMDERGLILSLSGDAARNSDAARAGEKARLFAQFVRFISPFLVEHVVLSAAEIKEKCHPD